MFFSYVYIFAANLIEIPKETDIKQNYKVTGSKKPRFLMFGTLIFSHNSQNMTYFVTKFGMRQFCVVP